MKSVFATLITGTFILIAAFGAFAMNHGGESAHGGCFAAAVQGSVDCPNAASSPLAFLSFHLNAFKFFSTAIFASHFGNLMLIVLAILLIVIFAINNRFKISSLSYEFAYHKRRSGTADFPLEQRTLSWIALHEKRDPAQFV